MTTKDPASRVVREPPRPKARRVYKTVTVVEEGGTYGVRLDGKPARTPAGQPLQVSSRALAEAVAHEWDAQEREIDPATMPLTRLVATARDRIAPQRLAVVAGLLGYANSDLLCYRADHPADLKARQQATWQPVLDWLDNSQGIALTPGQGLMPRSQSAAAVEGFRAAIEGLDDDRLTAFQACVSATHSLGLALALVRGRLSAAGVCAAAHLDEVYQMEKWGEDKLALVRLRQIEAEIHAIGEYLRLVV